VCSGAEVYPTIWTEVRFEPFSAAGTEGQGLPSAYLQFLAAVDTEASSIWWVEVVACSALSWPSGVWLDRLVAARISWGLPPPPKARPCPASWTKAGSLGHGRMTHGASFLTPLAQFTLDRSSAVLADPLALVNPRSLTTPNSGLAPRAYGQLHSFPGIVL